MLSKKLQATYKGQICREQRAALKHGIRNPESGIRNPETESRKRKRPILHTKPSNKVYFLFNSRGTKLWTPSYNENTWHTNVTFFSRFVQGCTKLIRRVYLINQIFSSFRRHFQVVFFNEVFNRLQVETVIGWGWRWSFSFCVQPPVSRKSEQSKLRWNDENQVVRT